MILQCLQRNTEMYDSMKVFALSAVIVAYCSVQSYPVYTENYDLNENNNKQSSLLNIKQMWQKLVTHHDKKGIIISSRIFVLLFKKK